MPDADDQPWVIAITVTLATFMEVLDTSIANVAAAAHRGDFVSGAGRIHVGADFLSRFKTRSCCRFRMVPA